MMKTAEESYSLTYAFNGGTKYIDGRYMRNTLVQLKKVPNREGCIFNGWYADERLTERITEIKMIDNKTVYAGGELTGVPNWLNGEDHFAYVIGYADSAERILRAVFLSWRSLAMRPVATTSYTGAT